MTCGPMVCERFLSPSLGFYAATEPEVGFYPGLARDVRKTARRKARGESDGPWPAAGRSYAGPTGHVHAYTYIRVCTNIGLHDPGNLMDPGPLLAGATRVPLGT
jgi:hypothetical protein